MTVIVKGKRKGYKVDVKQFISALLIITIAIASFGFFVDICLYTEKYSTIARKDLYNKIQEGNQEYIDYYNRNYTSKGKYLFGEERDLLNLTTVVGYETSDNGVLLLTNDGNEYLIQK